MWGLMIVWASHSQPPKCRSPFPNFPHPGTRTGGGGYITGNGSAPSLHNKELTDVEVWGFTVVWLPHSQASKPRSKDRERGKHHQEWFCPFLDNELQNNVCNIWGLTIVWVPHSQTPKSRSLPVTHTDPGIRIWMGGYVTRTAQPLPE